MNRQLKSVLQEQDFELPYIKMYHEFMIDQQLSSKKAKDFKRKYYPQFKMIAEARIGNNENEERVYKDLAAFLRKVTTDDAGDKSKMIYYTSKELKELMHLIDQLEKTKVC